MINLKSVPRRSESIVTRKTGNEYVLVPVTDNIADMNSVYTLNDSGAFIWELIDGKRDIEEMIEALVSRYDTDRETASEDLLSFIGKMSEYLVIDR
ncbi:MAG TPA: PqqD family protein [Bacteroidales bacterium]|mgnify:CR=1 FL=1|jgi:methyltransferase-like protein|nr:PqqD family protein [Bacteroidales bacterium]HQH23827.1 PqqD family protein [Bacteroidales bacterium]HQJ81652.1 PqqD family protein [Bacteroidales bacterium]